MKRVKANSKITRRNKSVWVSRFIGAAAVFLIASLFIIYLKKAVINLEYFKIKEVFSNENDIAEVSYLKGENIFTIDLIKEARYISTLYPNYKRIRLIRVLPNRLFIEFTKRKPLALLKLYRYFCIDAEAVLFDLPAAELPQVSLPLIFGLETKIPGPRPGARYNMREINLALNIIEEVDKNQLLKVCEIKKIDVASPINAAFFIILPSNTPKNPKNETSAPQAQEGLEIRIGRDDLKDRLAILSNLVTQIRNDWENIKYIDLRFKEPVIKFKDQ